MSKRETTARQHLIVNKLRQKPCDFNELHDYLARHSEMEDYKYTLSKRTLRRDLEDIESLYGIQIRFDFSRAVYWLEEDNANESATRLLEAYDMLHALRLSDGLAKHIHFETRKPQGTEHFHGLLHAIQARRVAAFRYEKYWDDTITTRKLQPYALKEAKGRWYVVGFEENSTQVKTFALDRISDLDITRKRFSAQKDFDVARYFGHAFGIMVEGEPVEVILSFGPEQGKYIKSYPLHHSQRALLDDADEYRIALKLHLTYDFLMELLAHGHSVRVIKPASLRKQIIGVAKRMVG